MKLPITDAFLWKLYLFIKKMDKAYDVLTPHTMRQVVYPEEHRLRREYQILQARTKFSQFIKNLGEKGYIKIKALEGTRGIVLTPKGAKRALLAKWKSKQNKKRRDGKWIMIIFDIPEKQRRTRGLLREALTNLGYQKLQQSAWVCPYDVYKETEEVIRSYRVTAYIKLFLIEEVVW